MKTFKQAFPTLNYDGDLNEYFDMAQIEKVIAPSDMSCIKIYVVLPRLIDSGIFRAMEKLIKERLFAKRNIGIHLVERFQLSGQYTPANLFEAYKENIYENLKSMGILEYMMLKNATVNITEDSLDFTVEDLPMNKDVASRVMKYLDNLFNVKCSVPCNITRTIVPATEKKEYVEEFAEPEKRAVKDEDFIDVNAEGKTSSLPDAEENVRANAAGSRDKPKKQSAKGQRSYNKEAAKTDPSLIYGRDFDGNLIPISDIIGEIGEVVVQGQICDLEFRHIEKNDLYIFIFTITDFTDSIQVKMFIKSDDFEEAKGAITNGRYVKLKGLTAIDRFDSELIIERVRGIKAIEELKKDKRSDKAPVKRVELHCHTKMSDNDGVSSADDIVKRASEWGMDAIAITDHGNVQSFPEAFHTVQGLKKKEKFCPKIIYGVEGYLVNDKKSIVTNPGDRKLDGSFVVFDLETTGLSVSGDRIIEIGAVKVEDNAVVDRFSCFVNPQIPIPYKIEKLTGINDSMVMNADTIDKVLPAFLEFCGEAVLVAHNASFDVGFIRRDATTQGLQFDPSVVDTLTLSQLLMPQLKRFKLDAVAKALEVELGNHHRAVDDAECTAGIFIKECRMLKEKDVVDLKGIDSLSDLNPNLIRRADTYHIIILVKNETGRVNLYRLISDSHIKYFNKRPRIPRSLLERFREGLIIGSACEAGELFRAVVNGTPEQELKGIVDFYDYLEIQPLGNNRFMIRDEKMPAESDEDLINYNKEIVMLGEKYNKPVVATGDVHFLNPEDEIYRRIIMFSMGYDDADQQAPLYLRTTDEMLAEFEYLGPDKAYEVVVTNSRKIADMTEYVEPVRPDKCPPVIENSDEELRSSCYAKAHEQYGENLPAIVEERLNKELTSIISNGYAVMYIIAKKLVEKSNSDGYLVGSRGSVGSSFAAYTSGITEVNPLPPHYYCTECKYSDFESEDVKAFAGMAGCDMPDKICPVCGKPLKKDGYDIPFETFLGFKGDKEPDIDLNFSGEYQAKAHAYTEVLFGKGHTFKAGTVGAIAEKTAFGYIKKYYDEHGERKRKCEINRLVKGCTGVKRTTGQHPGGIVVLPKGEEIYSFTPIQHPANDNETDIITTHFEYHAIDHNLLKLDILGHQAPTMIRKLQDISGIDPVKDIPFDSPETMSLFESTEVLGITPKDISGCQLGTLGIPEFGTGFAIQMLLEAKPKFFSDLVRIAGLAHGTDVWIGNARDLILSGQATISTAICTRDDIMIYLIQMGMDPSQSFKIMEAVRKGKGLTDEWEAAMREHNVPEWYITSCKKIKYMFPKAHAAAYVMMSWRIAYCKIFYPLAYYAAYFSIMGDGFVYDSCGQGPAKLKAEMNEIIKKGEAATDREGDILRDMKIVEELYARGFEILPVDIYKSHPTDFTIEDGKLRPALTSIEGLGANAAKSISKAAHERAFLSKEDFRHRAGVGASTVELMDKYELLKDIPDSDQISIFDMV